MDQVFEGGLAGERVVQDLLEHAKRVDIVKHRLVGEAVARLPAVHCKRLPSSLLGGVSLYGSWSGENRELVVTTQPKAPRVRLRRHCSCTPHMLQYFVIWCRITTNPRFA